MTALLNKLHSKLGDFWWYSLMLFFAIPIAVFASTFRNELTTLSINRKFGQMKTLMRGVFIATAIFLFLAMLLQKRAPVNP